MSFTPEALNQSEPDALVVDIGCGINKTVNSIGLDCYPHKGVDIVRDAEKYTLPFTSHTVDYIYAFDFIEHIEDWVYFFNECWRILKPGGKLEVHYPDGDSSGHKWHPAHKKAWYPQSFEYLRASTFPHMRAQLGLLADFDIKVNELNGDMGHEVGLVVMEAVKNYPDGFQMPWLTSDRVAVTNGHPHCKRVELGCGWTKRDIPGPFIGLDRHNYKGVDIICDLEKGLPFADSSVDLIFSSHVMEHANDLIFLIEECWRVLKMNGILEMITPKWDSVYAYANPDHKRFIHPVLWSYWNFDSNIMDKEACGVNARFKQLMNREEGEGLFTTLAAVKGG